VVDTEKLRKAVKHFSFSSRLSNRDMSKPCTAEDLEKVIHEVEKLMNAFIDELEKQ
jgi:hypothetical protein